MSPNQIKVGQHMIFDYKSENDFSPRKRYVKVTEINPYYVKGVDLMEEKFKQYRIDKMILLGVIAGDSEELYQIQSIHPNPDGLSDEQLISIFKIIYPNKKEVRTCRPDAPFIACLSDNPTLIINHNKVTFSNGKGCIVNITQGSLTKQDIKELKAFVQGLDS